MRSSAHGGEEQALCLAGVLCLAKRGLQFALVFVFRGHVEPRQQNVRELAADHDRVGVDQVVLAVESQRLHVRLEIGQDAADRAVLRRILRLAEDGVTEIVVKRVRESEQMILLRRGIALDQVQVTVEQDERQRQVLHDELLLVFAAFEPGVDESVFEHGLHDVRGAL